MIRYPCYLAFRFWRLRKTDELELQDMCGWWAKSFLLMGDPLEWVDLVGPCCRLPNQARRPRAKIGETEGLL